VIRFRDIDHAIAIANGPPTAVLAVCTNRLDYVTRFVRELNVGRSTCARSRLPLELTPFGGIKDSGLGYKEGSRKR